MEKISNVKSKFLLSVYLFIYIYMPPIASINPIHIMGLISWGLILLKYNKIFLKILKNKRIFLFLSSLIIAVILLSVILFFTTREFEYLNSIIYILTSVFPTAVVFSIYFHKKGSSIENVLDILLKVALMQSMIALIMFIFPNIKLFILENFYYEQFIVGKYSYLSINRIFGLTMGFTYAMPVVQGFMAYIAFVYSINKSIKYIFYIPILLLSAAINARVGVLVFFISILSYGILNFSKMKMNVKKIFKLIITIGLVILGVWIAIKFVGSKSKDITKWIIDAFYETKLFMLGEKVGYYEALSNFVFFPKGIELIYGTGQDYFGKTNPLYLSSTDIGYINDLFLGGVIFVSFLYFSLIKLYLFWNNKLKIEYRHISITIVILVGFLNIKGFAFKFSEFTNLFILISIFALTDIFGVQKK